MNTIKRKELVLSERFKDSSHINLLVIDYTSSRILELAPDDFRGLYSTADFGLHFSRRLKEQSNTWLQVDCNGVLWVVFRDAQVTYNSENGTRLVQLSDFPSHEIDGSDCILPVTLRPNKCNWEGNLARERET